MTLLSSLKLLTRRGPVKHLLRACHSGRLVGGLSISLRALPDEVVGGLTHAMGAAGFRVLDVRTGTPMVMEVAWREVHEKWEVEHVEGLVHNLNDLFRDEPTVKVVAVLGEWEDMLQLWCLSREVLGPLLEGRVLDEARNLRTLWQLHEGSRET
jgi:hypothetical protein